MPATRNSKPAPRSSGAGEAGEIWPVLLVFVLLAVWSAAAVAYFYRQGFLLYYGDAEAHLNIARRIVDSRTPGYDQIGTVWLPLLHVLLIPFARVNHLWQSGLAAAFPSAAAFVLAGTFLFAAVRRIFASTAAAGAAAAIFALNPNLLYLQSTAMSEPLFLATLMGLLYFTVRFGRNPWWGSLGGAALACLAGTLARYEGWFLIPSERFMCCAPASTSAGAKRWCSARSRAWARSTGWRTTGGAAVRGWPSFPGRIRPKPFRVTPAIRGKATGGRPGCTSARPRG